MDDEAELQAKIAALAGQINKRKQQAPTQHAPHHPPQHNRGASRWTPYGGHGAFQPHKNRTLVLGGKQHAPPPTPADVERPAQTALSPPRDTFVTARRAGVNQLMTKEAFERMQNKMKQNKPETQPAAKQPSRAHKIAPALTSKPPVREMDLDGLRFQVLNDGSKLIRIPGEQEQFELTTRILNPTDPSTGFKETPKKATIAGIDFLRTKHGNLIRATISKSTPRYRVPRHFGIGGLDSHFDDHYRRNKPQCENFTKHGTCTFGPACRFTHDPTKVAICKEFLRNGSCKSGRDCDLSHELTYQRVPACTHFLRSNCTNSACRYPHVNTDPNARVCRRFATLGFCPKGVECDQRHVFECPDYSNHGRCDGREKGACSLPHVDRAGNLRKAAKRQAKTGSNDESDMSSDEEEESDHNMEDVDSDVAEDEIVMGSTDDSHALSQQQDFIAFT